jgi:hypothetical protein
VFVRLPFFFIDIPLPWGHFNFGSTTLLFLLDPSLGLFYAFTIPKEVLTKLKAG